MKYEIWDEDEARSVLQHVFDGHYPDCPRGCEVPVEGAVNHALMGVAFIEARCDFCGAKASAKNDEFTIEPETKWSDEDLREMAKSYLRNGHVTCPTDGGQVKVFESELISTVKSLQFHCMKCSQSGTWRTGS